MKFLIIILSALLVPKSGSTQSIAVTSIPINIITALNAKYPAARNCKWKIEKDGLVAAFKLSNKRCSAYFSTGGNWIKTESKLSVARHTPAVIKNALYKSEYSAWYIDDIKEVEQPASHVYLVNVNNANVLKIADPFLFKDVYQLTFSENGALLKKEKLP